MTARKRPSERRQRLGVELRKMRERAGLTLTEAAERHQVDKTTVSNTEAARFGVSADRVRVWASNYGQMQRSYIDALASIARERQSPEWWHEFRGMVDGQLLDLAELEHRSMDLCYVRITHVPELLQHEEYARAVHREAVPAVSPENTEALVAFQERRRRLLDSAASRRLEFLVHEAALHIGFGGRKVARRQLEYLLAESGQGPASVRVIPFAVGGIPSAGSSCLYARGPVPELDTVQRDDPTGMSFLHSEAHLTHYHSVLSRLGMRSLEPDASRDLILRILQDL